MLKVFAILDSFFAYLSHYPTKLLTRLFNISNFTVARISICMYTILGLIMGYLLFSFLTVFAAFFGLYMGLNFIRNVESAYKKAQTSDVFPISRDWMERMQLGRPFLTIFALQFLLLTTMANQSVADFILPVAIAMYAYASYAATDFQPRHPSRIKALLRKTRKLMRAIRNWRPTPSPVPQPRPIGA